MERIRVWLSYAPVFILAAMVLAGAKTFSLQSAAGGYCLEVEVCREETLSRYAHIPRAALLEPMLWIAKAAGINPNLFFGLVCCVSLAYAGYLMALVYAGSVSNRSAQYFLLFYLASLCTISLFMNGRGVPAFTGFALIIASVALHEERRIGRSAFAFLVTLGLLLASVSTGTFIVVACVLLYRMLSRVVGSGRTPDAASKEFGFWIVAVLILSPMAGLAVWKNLSYFGGLTWESARGLFGHGAGEFLVNHGLMTAGVVATLLPLLFLAGRSIIKSGNKTTRLMTVATALSLSAGLFGYFTLSLAVVPVLYLVLASVLNRVQSSDISDYGSKA